MFRGLKVKVLEKLNPVQCGQNTGHEESIVKQRYTEVTREGLDGKLKM